MGAVFDTRPVEFFHGADILGIGVAPFAILEIEKRAITRMDRRRQGAAIRSARPMAEQTA